MAVTGLGIGAKLQENVIVKLRDERLLIPRRIADIPVIYSVR
jgi:hypothetical protein